MIHEASDLPRGASCATENVDAIITLLVWDAHSAVMRLLDSLDHGIARTASWRLFILDQGSASPTVERLDAFSRRPANAVTLLRLDANIGYPAGHNLLHRTAVRCLAPRYLVTLNSDVVFHDPDWLDRLVRFMDDHPRVGLAGPTGVIYERTPSDRLGWCRVAEPEETRAGRYDSISGSVCIIRQTLIEQIGLFDESFTPGYYEDTDLAFRATHAGWHLAHCPIAHGHHDLGPEQSTSVIKHKELAARYGNFQKRNRDLFVDRWLSGRNYRLNETGVRALFPRVYMPVSSVRTMTCPGSIPLETATK